MKDERSKFRPLSKKGLTSNLSPKSLTPIPSHRGEGSRMID